MMSEFVGEKSASGAWFRGLLRELAGPLVVLVLAVGGHAFLAAGVAGEENYRALLMLVMGMLVMEVVVLVAAVVIVSRVARWMLVWVRGLPTRDSRIAWLIWVMGGMLLSLVGLVALQALPSGWWLSVLASEGDLFLWRSGLWIGCAVLAFWMFSAGNMLYLDFFGKIPPPVVAGRRGPRARISECIVSASTSVGRRDLAVMLSVIVGSVLGAVAWVMFVGVGLVDWSAVVRVEGFAPVVSFPVDVAAVLPGLVLCAGGGALAVAALWVGADALCWRWWSGRWRRTTGGDAGRRGAISGETARVNQ
ncbi:hypothetical protein [Microbacterium gorillae]|uniref:hypothetical protein n=1 Tax=Microbacterium gorillae TaxID=1231063 RepID=UPI0005911E10|nr:hypothetical protein [Microbacterium gorillae]